MPYNEKEYHDAPVKQRKRIGDDAYRSMENSSSAKLKTNLDIFLDYSIVCIVKGARKKGRELEQISDILISECNDQSQSWKIVYAWPFFKQNETLNDPAVYFKNTETGHYCPLIKKEPHWLNFLFDLMDDKCYEVTDSTIQNVQFEHYIPWKVKTVYMDNPITSDVFDEIIEIGTCNHPKLDNNSILSMRIYSGKKKNNAKSSYDRLGEYVNWAVSTFQHSPDYILKLFNFYSLRNRPIQERNKERYQTQRCILMYAILILDIQLQRSVEAFDVSLETNGIDPLFLLFAFYKGFSITLASESYKYTLEHISIVCGKLLDKIKHKEPLIDNIYKIWLKVLEESKDSMFDSVPYYISKKIVEQQLTKEEMEVTVRPLLNELCLLCTKFGEEEMCHIIIEFSSCMLEWFVPVQYDQQKID